MARKEGTCLGRFIRPVNHDGYIRVREGRGRFECDCLSQPARLRDMARKEGTLWGVFYAQSAMTAVETAFAQCTSRCAMRGDTALSLPLFWRQLLCVRSFSGCIRGRAFTLSPSSPPVPVPNKQPRFSGHKAIWSRGRFECDCLSQQVRGVARKEGFFFYTDGVIRVRGMG